MKDNGKGGGVLGNALTKSLSLVMKGSNLSTIAAMDGSFSLNKVPAGTYYVIPQLAGYVSPIGQLSQKERMQAGDAAMKALANGAEKVEVQADSTAIVNIELVRGASISGTIRYDDGSPAPGVTPVLLSLGVNGKWSELPPPSMLPTVTSDDGQFRFSGLPTGRYSVKAALPTSAATMGIGLSSLSMHVNTGDALVAYSGDVLWERDLKPIELKAGTERAGVDIVFPVNGLHSVSGTVVAMADGHSINTGSVELEDPSTKASVRMTMIGRDGSFQFDYVPEGTYRVEVTGALDVES
ncbi:MAG TPA: carboxypeptidase-like regulatory domain-containing protein, partial [Acidobacteriaceae bacterium]|nr:carboxypeptidase-like regulatory domain-containing protein [Acidobacteriaceae bacterium]